MTCCAGPLIASGVAASVITVVSGLIGKDLMLVIGGLIGVVLIGGGYLYRKQLTEKFNSLISRL